MTRSRDRRIARSAFRQHSDLGVYISKDGEETPVRYIYQHKLDLDGEYGEMVIEADMVDVLVSELPKHDVSQSYLHSTASGDTYLLGRVVSDDDQVRTIEVTKQ